jgi:uracil-DNA glycosylase
VPFFIAEICKMPKTPTTSYDENCTACPRLAKFLVDTKTKYPSYFCKPVNNFGAATAQLLIVGLAPGMHGANATGRPFTGDHAGILLYETLHKFSFANKPVSITADDDLALINCRISNAVKCLPPDNKPTLGEIKTCNHFLAAEINAFQAPCKHHEDGRNKAILALGLIAHQAVLRALGKKNGDAKFAHGAAHDLTAGTMLFDSYHCSRYNTNTKRLTTEGFEAVFSAINKHLTSHLAPRV